MKSIKSPSWSKRLFGLNPVRVPPHVFSVNEKSLDYLCLSPDAELSCEESWRVELSEDCFQGGPLGGRPKDREALHRGLDALLGRMIHRPTEASLVIPDNWLRLTFVEVEDWPRRRADQLQVLRFKLGRIVPFRVEELRIGFQRVAPLTEGNEHRFLVGFGIEAAFEQLEEIFEDRQIRIGNLANASLSLLRVLQDSLAPAPLGAFVSVDDDRYSVTVTQHGSPVVYRGKAHGANASLSPVARELRLTKSFLQERVNPGIVSELILVAPEEREPSWRSILEEVFEVPVGSLSRDWPSIPGLSNLSTKAAAPLLGAALREIA